MSPSAWATPAVPVRRRPAGPAPIRATTGRSSPSPSVAPAIAAPSPAPPCDPPMLLPLAAPRAGGRSHPLPPACGFACGYQSRVSPCPCLLSTGDEDWSADRTELSSTRSYEVTPAGPVCVRRAAVLTQATPKSVGIRTVSQPVGPAKPDTQSGLSELRGGDAGADGGIRTHDLPLTRRLLCQLSYVGDFRKHVAIFDDEI